MHAVCHACLVWPCGQNALAVGALGAPTMDSACGAPPFRGKAHFCIRAPWIFSTDWELSSWKVANKLSQQWPAICRKFMESSYMFWGQVLEGCAFHPKTNLLMEFPCEVSAPNGQQVASRFLFAWSSNDSDPPNVLKPPTSKEVWVGNVDGVLGTNRSIN